MGRGQSGNLLFPDRFQWQVRLATAAFQSSRSFSLMTEKITQRAKKKGSETTEAGMRSGQPAPAEKLHEELLRQILRIVFGVAVMAKVVVKGVPVVPAQLIEGLPGFRRSGRGLPDQVPLGGLESGPLGERGGFARVPALEQG